jgi:hypothetical protein
MEAYSPKTPFTLTHKSTGQKFYVNEDTIFISWDESKFEPVNIQQQGLGI